MKRSSRDLTAITKSCTGVNVGSATPCSPTDPNTARQALAPPVDKGASRTTPRAAMKDAKRAERNWPPNVGHLRHHPHDFADVTVDELLGQRRAAAQGLGLGDGLELTEI